ncbi:MarR family transcriptional regulator [Brevundimonas sp.]|uniref:MarR family winged helix-turn-helix transcriptional regulator n=1 Tax=Brevundimonas sp. TaxID=1871086 RepID=UPI0028982D5A|nr:MarR family transcriptional regulator [Brevundimonas sp.]
MTNISPDRARFGVTFSLLARRWRRLIEAHLATTGLTDATWLPLVHLDATGGGLTQKELAALVGVDGSSLVRVLDILERDGLIERRRDAADGRARLIHLTESGETRVAEIQTALKTAETAMLVDLSDADLGVMLENFRAIDRRMAEREGPGGAKA